MMQVAIKGPLFLHKVHKLHDLLETLLNASNKTKPAISLPLNIDKLFVIKSYKHNYCEFPCQLKTYVLIKTFTITT